MEQEEEKKKKYNFSAGIIQLFVFLVTYSESIDCSISIVHIEKVSLCCCMVSNLAKLVVAVLVQI